MERPAKGGAVCGARGEASGPAAKGRRPDGAGRLLPRVNVVLRFDAARLEDLRAVLLKGGFKLDARPNALLFAQRPGATLTVYRTGKLLLTGPQAEEFAGVLAGRGLVEFEATPQTLAFEPHAGSDESGKGDYFGPLAVACVHVPDRATADALAAKGVRDSKLAGNDEVGPLAALVRARCPHATVVIMPERYNEMYALTPNLNDLLAWAHARAIEDLRAKAGAVPIVVDQFARPDVLERHLMQRGREAPVAQIVRGESDVAVAAASLVARAEFLAGLAALESRTGARLPPGAGAPTIRAAREFVARRGSAALREVAKLHFATTKTVLG